MAPSKLLAGNNLWPVLSPKPCGSVLLACAKSAETVQTSEQYGQLCADAAAQTEALLNLLLQFEPEGFTLKQKGGPSPSRFQPTKYNYNSLKLSQVNDNLKNFVCKFCGFLVHHVSRYARTLSQINQTRGQHISRSGGAGAG